MTDRAEFWGYFAGLADDDAISRDFDYADTKGRPHRDSLQAMMQQVVFHGVYHRGQITARLLDAGFDEHVVYTDLIQFYRQRSGR